MVTFQIGFTDELILPNAGLIFVGTILCNSGFTDRLTALTLQVCERGTLPRMVIFLPPLLPFMLMESHSLKL